MLCVYSALETDAFHNQDRYSPASEIKRLGYQQKKTLCHEEFSVESQTSFGAQSDNM